MSIFQLSSILTLTLLIALYLFRWIYRKPKRKLPPQLAKLPVIGNFHQMVNYNHRSLQRLSKKHGPLFLLHLGKVPVLVISSSDAAREIIKTNDHIFCSRPKTTMPDKLFYNSTNLAFSPYNEYWRQIKSITVLNLLSNKRVQSYRRVREEEMSNMVKKITDASSNNHMINISDIFASLMSDVASRAILGFKLGETEKGKRFKNLLPEWGYLLGAHCIGDYVPWLWWVDRVSGLFGKAEKVAMEIDEVLQSIINDHVEKGETESKEGEGRTFLEILLEIQRDNKLGFPISTNTVKALLLGMYTGGTDSTSTLLTWTVAELLRQPHIMIKLQNEVRQIVGNKPNVSEADIEKMSYLKLVVKESLRLHPPFPVIIPRESTQSASILGYDIQAGTQAFLNVWAIGRDPSVWENPDEFKPERFINIPLDFKGINFFGSIPFGGGRRGCPGIQFALAVNELALATLLYKFDIEAEELDMSESIGQHCRMKFPLLVSARSHSSV